MALPKSDSCDVLIVGGGFFGMYIAEFLALQGKRVVLVESAEHCMTRASYANQARVHNGYHYPRSVLTALRSRISFPRFVAEFPDCVKDDFDKYYAIGKILGKVTARQFDAFCRRIGAPCELAPPRISAMFDSHYIEAVFSTREFAFDAAKLRQVMAGRLEAAGVELVRGCRAEKVALHTGPGLLVDLDGGDAGTVQVAAGEVYNCTYSHLNYLPAHSGMELIPLKHEMTEMALVEPPEELATLGITVMCGPFFSLMPFPDRRLHTLSHVRYTPHYEWHDRDGADYRSSHAIFQADPHHSQFEAMRLDAARYLPAAGQCRYRDSLWEVKTLLPASEIDDSRPILFKTDYGLPNFHCVMGGKLDNVYDVIDAIKLRQNGKSIQI